MLRLSKEPSYETKGSSIQLVYILDTSNESEHESESDRSNAFAQAFSVANCPFAAGIVLCPLWGELILTHLGNYDMVDQSSFYFCCSNIVTFI
jgi:hypothetical protein